LPGAAQIIAFAAIAFGLVITPGPNMIYLLSRSISQGPVAGLQSLVGIAGAFIIFALFAAFGITALFAAFPIAFNAVKAAGAAYLLYLAWQVLRPGGRSPLEVRELPRDSPRKLVAMGFMTNFLNPKAAVLYFSLLPQFIVPSQGRVLEQLLVLVATQIAISMSVNATIVVFAGMLASTLKGRPAWLLFQRWLMGSVLGGLAFRMLAEGAR
jgi:threonine/homoserine/homoserine lactone efflux protein